MGAMPRGDLFPDIAPYETGLLPLSGGHVMYWEQVGNPRGQPVLFLHGGPGAPSRCSFCPATGQPTSTVPNWWSMAAWAAC